MKLKVINNTLINHKILKEFSINRMISVAHTVIFTGNKIASFDELTNIRFTQT